MKLKKKNIWLFKKSKIIKEKISLKIIDSFINQSLNLLNQIFISIY